MPSIFLAFCHWRQKIGLLGSACQRASTAFLFILANTRAANRLRRKDSFLFFSWRCDRLQNPVGRGQSSAGNYAFIFGFVVAHLFFVVFVGPPI
ncbi:hypothetical protein pclt_cds_459 [Pandoravirus celtis]|uniref:Uncharacterized protein n=1 Tax=Pandoravirus celtis TaxID=2568002 RepID=A0A4D6EH82_9VIRU|nr:hypothetical protein pclt_cds_459 [Pandoravirus celtis]